MASATFSTLRLTVHDHPLELSTIHRPGPKPAILFLHGFGSCKEDLHDLIFLPSLQDHAFIAYDAPGCGASLHHGPSSDLTIPFLVATAQAVLSHFHISSFYLIGHSTGALTALMLASALQQQPQFQLQSQHRQQQKQQQKLTLLAFINIEGILSPENCPFSRSLYKSLTQDNEEQESDPLKTLTTALTTSPTYGHIQLASLLPLRIRPAAIAPLVTSTVDLSWKNLLGRFVRLSCPAMFMFGDQNRNCSFLDQLEANGVELVRIPMCGHFPMYSNPAKMLRRIEGFLRELGGYIFGGFRVMAWR
ncbi:alpha/beta-hydrolase [Aspergillus ellipticus CBS 707.79]|uniref:Alpha/beta-hydrolase n=1 Tax=Aspergillus ellipticus CBS 707.79 TaxID=1448320 RepID=A0A319EWR5_9EURO|nr:alpha/beta-hydrolase [Aspergillus ellipticus CBS 707.79]